MNVHETPLSPLEIAEGLWFYHAGPQPIPESDELDLLADRFIQLKQHLGHRYLVNSQLIQGLLHFLRQHRVQRASQLSLDVMNAWAASRSHVQASTWMRELNAVSVFLAHLKAIGKVPQNPCLLLSPRRIPPFRPYIFSLDELKRVCTRTDQGGPPADRGLLYHLTYAGALRCRETAHLRIRDVDFEQGVLQIWKTKFQKDRLVPLHPRVIERLRSYRDSVRADAPLEAPLFLNHRGHAHQPHGLSWLFQDDLKRLGLHRPPRTVDGVRFGTPRMHSLRHSFAVHRLLRWYRSGADVQSKLPLLSTFLGHSSVAHTQVYLQITTLLLREAHSRFSARWEKEFPLSP